jgi:hypothetical protein
MEKKLSVPGIVTAGVCLYLLVQHVEEQKKQYEQQQEQQTLQTNIRDCGITEEMIRQPQTAGNSLDRLGKVFDQWSTQLERWTAEYNLDQATLLQDQEKIAAAKPALEEAKQQEAEAIRISDCAHALAKAHDQALDAITKARKDSGG